MRKIYYLPIVIALFFVSCQKEVPVSDIQQPVVRTITASFDSPGSKTILSTEDNMTPLWQENDVIRIFGKKKVSDREPIDSYEDITLEADKIDGSRATFTTGLVGDLYAVYPASATKMTMCADGDIDFIIPDSQDGSFSSANICVAKGRGDKLLFHNATAVLEFSKLSVNVEESGNLNRIFVKAANAVAGPLTASFLTGDNVISHLETEELTSKTVMAIFPAGVEKCYIAVAPVAAGATDFRYYTDELMLSVDSYEERAELESNVIYAMPVPDPSSFVPDYVEIEADYDRDPETPNTVLRWAKENLALSASGMKDWKGANAGYYAGHVVGDYFQWGASYAGYAIPTSGQKPQNLVLYNSFTSTACGDAASAFEFKDESRTFSQKSNSPYLRDGNYTKYRSSNVEILERNDDIARISLRGAVRMPTNDEFRAMHQATYWVWSEEDKGYYVFAPQGDDAGKVNDGIGSYDNTEALLFFPAAGYVGGTKPYVVGSIGYYWSSTYSGGEYANCLFFSNSTFSAISSPDFRMGRHNGYPVRPVLEASTLFQGEGTSPYTDNPDEDWFDAK